MAHSVWTGDSRHTVRAALPHKNIHLALFVGRVIYNYCIADEDSHSRELQEGTLDQNEYERRYADLTEKYNTIKADYDKISEQIESKKAQRELFKGFIRALEKQGALLEEFDEGLWSSLVQEVVVNAKDDIRFIFKNGFEIKTR